MVFYPNDYTFGIKEEELIHASLKRFFKRDIKRSEEATARHDYHDDEYNYELKSRTNNYSKYPTTMITENKICGDKKLILLFNFTDALYYIEYNEEQFANYYRQPFSRAGYKWDEKIHLYIPITDLTLICKREDYFVPLPFDEVILVPAVV
jgi:hypothetical protein